MRFFVECERVGCRRVQLLQSDEPEEAGWVCSSEEIGIDSSFALPDGWRAAEGQVFCREHSRALAEDAG